MRLLLVLLCLAGPAAGQLLTHVVPAGDIEAFAVTCDCDLMGYRVEDGEGGFTFPSARGTVWVANDTRLPRLWPGHESLVWTDRALRLADGGDALFLLDPQGEVVDTVAWGDAKAAGFKGSLEVSHNLVLTRDGDTDHARDFQTPRLHRIGESNIEATSYAARITVFLYPDHAWSIWAGLIESARERLILHIYELRHPALIDLLAKKAEAGVAVAVLVEEAPVGQDEDERLATYAGLGRLREAGADVWLAGPSTYRFHHLKVLVSDDSVIVATENAVASGLPVDPSIGNRGMGVVVQHAWLADHVDEVLAMDRRLFDAVPPPDNPAAASRAPPAGDHVSNLGPVSMAALVRPIWSPDHTADPATDPVVTILRAAKQRIYVQHLDLATFSSNPLGWKQEDAWLTALVDAARAGLDVRVQLAAPFAKDDTGNAEALARLRAAGALTSTFDHPDLRLHNKAILVDDRVLVVGSMNGNHHSRSNNRELTLVVEGDMAPVAHWFEADWRPPPRDWGVVEDDLRGLPFAGPILFALLLLAARRWRSTR